MSSSRAKGLNAELNPICHLLALLGAHHILRISRIKVKLPHNVRQIVLFQLFGRLSLASQGAERPAPGCSALSQTQTQNQDSVRGILLDKVALGLDSPKCFDFPLELLRRNSIFIHLTFVG